MKIVYVLLVTTLLVAGCRGKRSHTAVQNEEPPAAAFRMGASVRTNDTQAAQQLLKGFYGIEGSMWRWTAGKFSVQLKPPVTSAEKGATLKFALAVPDVITQKLGTVKLTAITGGTELRTESYSKPGSYTFTADVPASALTKDTVTIDFALDKALPPGPADGRELGVIASSFALEAK